MDYSVLGIGQIIWDLTVNVSFEYLETLNIESGGHKIVDSETFHKILSGIKQLTEKPKIFKNPGGSTANIMSNLAKIGTPSAFIGKHGDDEKGRKFMQILRDEGVHTYSILDHENETGQLLSLITPDKDRTFIVYHGASKVLPAEMIKEELLKALDLIHVEGYLALESEKALWKIFKESETIAFDLAAYSVVDKTRALLQKVFSKYPPKILFCNIFEGKAFTKKTKKNSILEDLLEYSSIAVLTLGEEGVLIGTREGEKYHQKAIPTKVVDTTGAGDSFCAGFLHEFLKTGDIKAGAALGVKSASTTIREIGARSLSKQKLREILQKTE
ncbi:MAG: adenosine kinase [Asgard group archaeon]|nr:adenosine kinase [Asgard group archaeon]